MNSDLANNMTNLDDMTDMANKIDWIESRRSIGKMSLPAPNEQQIQQAIHCAMTAPDHKQLKPWRFFVVQDTARQALSDVFLSAAQAKADRLGETIDDATQQKTLNMALRAPVIITVVTRVQYHEKVPYFEQMLSTGACVQNLILALKAQGFASIWRTGLLANEPEVKRYFNVGAEDYIAGFVYTGTSDVQMPKRANIDLKDYVIYK